VRVEIEFHRRELIEDLWNFERTVYARHKVRSVSDYRQNLLRGSSLLMPILFLSKSMTKTDSVLLELIVGETNTKLDPRAVHRAESSTAALHPNITAELTASDSLFMKLP